MGYSIILSISYISIELCSSLECEIHTKLQMSIFYLKKKSVLTVVAYFVFIANTAIKMDGNGYKIIHICFLLSVALHP